MAVRQMGQDSTARRRGWGCLLLGMGSGVEVEAGGGDVGWSCDDEGEG
jgi:hypothetical protein